LFLEQYGVRPQIVDMHERTHQHSYALAIHPRTLAVFDEAGLSDALIAGGRTLTKVAFYDGRERRAEIDYSRLGARHPHLLVIRQSVLEHTVEDALKRKDLKPSGRMSRSWSRSRPAIQSRARNGWSGKPRPCGRPSSSARTATTRPCGGSLGSR
jgi:hypothetical protein